MEVYIIAFVHAFVHRVGPWVAAGAVIAGAYWIAGKVQLWPL